MEALTNIVLYYRLNKRGKKLVHVGFHEKKDLEKEAKYRRAL